MLYIHPNANELNYLRMLLNIIKGSRSFEEIKTISDVVHPTYQSVCFANGLLANDKEWIEAIEEAICSSSELRHLSTPLINFCEVSEPNKLFEKFWLYFSDDI